MLGLLPEDVGIVLALDLDRLRGQPIWKDLSPVLARLAGALFDDIAAGTGLEPARQIRRLWVGLPAERQEDGRFLLLADTDALDAERARAWLSGRSHGRLTVRVPGPHHIAIGAGAWVQHLDGERSRRAGPSPELRRLCQRAAGEHGLWFAALVPPRLRQIVRDGDRFADVAGMVRVFGFLDDGTGLRGELVGEFANSDDPVPVAHRLSAVLQQAKRNPDMLIAGLAPYLEAVRVEARDASVRVTLDLPDPQTADLIERIEALALDLRTKYSRAREQP